MKRRDDIIKRITEVIIIFLLHEYKTCTICLQIIRPIIYPAKVLCHVPEFLRIFSSSVVEVQQQQLHPQGHRLSPTYTLALESLYILSPQRSSSIPSLGDCALTILHHLHNENRNMPFLLATSISLEGHHIRPQRRQNVPILSVKMVCSVLDQALRFLHES
jgi:hypothetical protein